MDIFLIIAMLTVRLLINNKGIDKYGVQAYQSAPAYSDLNNKKNSDIFPME